VGDIADIGHDITGFHHPAIIILVPFLACHQHVNIKNTIITGEYKCSWLKAQVNVPAWTDHFLQQV
jgi:hypothetical protein